MNRDTETLRRPDILSDPDDAYLESRHRQRGQLDQFVCRLKCIKDGRQPQIKDAIESKNLYAHGNNDIKNGALASGRNVRGTASWTQLFVKGRHDMVTLSLFARLEAKPGKEEEVAAFLLQGLKMAKQETTTPVWFALRLGRSTFAVFDGAKLPS